MYVAMQQLFHPSVLATRPELNIHLKLPYYSILLLLQVNPIIQTIFTYYSSNLT